MLIGQPHVTKGRKDLIEWEDTGPISLKASLVTNMDVNKRSDPIIVNTVQNSIVDVG